MSAEERSEDRTQTSAARAIALAAGRFFWRNRRYVARDLVAALAWVLVLSAVFVVAPLPAWLYYVLLFGGLLVYSLVVSVAGAAAKLSR